MAGEGSTIHRDWSELCGILLELIANRMSNISDFIHFRSVCRKWRSAGNPNLLRPQPPLLLLPRYPASGTCIFFSVSTGELSYIYVPEVADKEVVSAAHGWLVLLDDRTRRVLSLLNPVTGEAIRLPPTDNFNDSVEWEGKVFLSSSPGADDCFVVVLRCYERKELAAFCRPGEEGWSLLRTGLLCPSKIVYHNDRFYSIDVLGNIYGCDAAAPENPVEIFRSKAPWFKDGLFLIKTDETLFCIIMNYTRTKLSKFRTRFQIYKADLNGLLGWSEVDTVGDYALFQSDSQMLICCLKDFPWKKDCIYSTYCLDMSMKEGDDRTKVYFFDLDLRTYGYISTTRKMPKADLAGSKWVTRKLVTLPLIASRKLD